MGSYDILSCGAHARSSSSWDCISYVLFPHKEFPLAEFELIRFEEELLYPPWFLAYEEAGNFPTIARYLTPMLALGLDFRPTIFH